MTRHRTPALALATLFFSLPAALYAQVTPSAPERVIRVEPAVLTLELPYERRAWRDPNRISHLVVSAQLGVLNQATTGTVADYGYDTGTAPSVGLRGRYWWPITGCSCGMGHGLDASVSYANGPTLGALHSGAWERVVADLGYSYRVEFPCMRRADRRVYLSGVLGLSFQHANAGLGDVSRDNAAGLNVRESAARAYDHASLGWRLGGDLEMYRGRTVYGFGVDLRSLHALSGDQARTFMLGAHLSLGWDFWI